MSKKQLALELYFTGPKVVVKAQSKDGMPYKHVPHLIRAGETNIRMCIAIPSYNERSLKKRSGILYTLYIWFNASL